MVNACKRLLSDERGQGLAEYGVALLVIGLGAAVAAVAIAGDVSTLWSKASSIIAAAV